MKQPDGPQERRRDDAHRTVAMGQRFWRQAGADLATARALLTVGSFYAVADFGHEAAEKSIKAACWHLRAAEPPWIHDLGALAELAAGKPEAIPQGVDEAVDLLEAMFERIRYPSGDLGIPIPAELIGEEDAHAALEAAEEVLSWVERLLQSPRDRKGGKSNS